jgi:hypothetical protein
MYDTESFCFPPLLHTLTWKNHAIYWLIHLTMLLKLRVFGLYVFKWNMKAISKIEIKDLEGCGRNIFEGISRDFVRR